MSAWKLRLGDPEHFAFELELRGEDAPEGHPEPELLASWGSFQLWVDGVNLCSHYEEGERLEAVHWYLLPLVEWWVEHWDPLFHEERLAHAPKGPGFEPGAWGNLLQSSSPPRILEPEEEDDWLDTWQAWWRRHCIQAAREGGLFPGVVLRRWRDLIEISWGEGGVVAAPDHFRFTSTSGCQRLEPERVAMPLYELLGETIKQLRRSLPDSQRLAALFERWESLSATPIDHRLRWMAGLGESVWRRFKRAIEQASEVAEGAFEVLFPNRSPNGNGLVVVGSCQAPLMFGCLAPTVAEEDLLTLAKLQLDAYQPKRGLSAIDDLAESTEVDRRPWEQGYELAESVLGSLGVSASPIDLDSLLPRLGVQVKSEALSDPEIRGVAFVGPDQRPTLLINKANAANTHLFGRRFTLAHELCHLLYDRDRAQALALASGPWTSADIEKRANAFAAMLLIPTSAVRDWVARHGPLETREAVRELSEVFQVGFQATLRHLENLDFLSLDQRQRIEAEI